MAIPFNPLNELKKKSPIIKINGIIQEEMKESVLAEESQEIQKQSEPVITVKMIHDSFLGAQDELIENNKKLKETEVNEDFSALYDLGFTGVKKADDAKKKLITKKSGEKMLDVVSYYSHHYPQNKFITYSQVDVLLKKYNLLMDYPNAYIGDVPDHIAKQIINFRLRAEDTFLVRHDRRHVYQKYLFHGKPNQSLCTRSKLNDILDVANISQRIKHSLRTLARPTVFGIDVEDADELLRFGIKFDSKGYSISQVLSFNDSAMKIIAPEHMMSKEVMEANRRAILDPIVLCPVESGYLIVALWGDESSIEEVQNPNLN